MLLGTGVTANDNRDIVFVEAGDLNDDGELDYYSYYPNGDRQTIYVFPLPFKLADYEVTPNAAFAKEGRPIVFINVGDLNGDGEPDYHSYYANGDRQTIYILPAP